MVKVALFVRFYRDLLGFKADPADVRCGSTKRVASAVGEGSMAVQFVHQYLASS
jgi:hypothetical protein